MNTIQLDRSARGEQYEVFSAGSNPTQVNPFAIKIMAEIGIDISKQVSKSIKEFRNKEIDLAVSVCRSSAKLTCSLCSSPIVMGRPEIINTLIPGAKHYLHHGFNDPSEWTEVMTKRSRPFDVQEMPSKSG